MKLLKSLIRISFQCEGTSLTFAPQVPPRPPPKERGGQGQGSGVKNHARGRLGAEFFIEYFLKIQLSGFEYINKIKAANNPDNNNNE